MKQNCRRLKLIGYQKWNRFSIWVEVYDKNFFSPSIQCILPFALLLKWLKTAFVLVLSTWPKSTEWIQIILKEVSIRSMRNHVTPSRIKKGRFSRMLKLLIKRIACYRHTILLLCFWLKNRAIFWINSNSDIVPKRRQICKPESVATFF